MKDVKVGISVLSLSLLFVSAAQAQATRTWISGVGDDANPCDRTAPCKTFAGAISKTAAGGEIDALDPGGFGALTITKSITIDGGGGQVASVLASSINGMVISAPDAVVTIRNMNFNGSGTGLNGIRLIQAKALHIENCAIFGFTGHGIDVEPNSGAAAVFIDRTVSRDNGGSGVFLQDVTPSVTAMITNSHFDNNGGSGVIAGDNSKVTVRDTTASGNTGAGFQAMTSGASASLNLVNSTTANNAGAGVQAGGTGANATVRISGVTAFSNASALSTGAGGGIYSYGNNYLTGVGNPTQTIPPK